LQDVEGHREERCLHHLGENALERVLRQQVTGPEAQPARRQKGRTEERQAANVIDMGVAEE